MCRSPISSCFIKADEVSNNDNTAFLNAVYSKGEPAKNTDDTLYASVNASDYLVLRTDSNAQAKEITRLPYGYNLTVLGAEKGWVEVKSDDNITGYVNGKLQTRRSIVTASFHRPPFAVNRDTCHCYESIVQKLAK